MNPKRNISPFALPLVSHFSLKKKSPLSIVLIHDERPAAETKRVRFSSVTLVLLVCAISGTLVAQWY